MSEHANCDSHRRKSQGGLEDRPVPEEECLFNGEVPECPPVRALRLCLAGLVVDKEEASLLSLWAVRGQVNQEMRKGLWGGLL